MNEDMQKDPSSKRWINTEQQIQMVFQTRQTINKRQNKSTKASLLERQNCTENDLIPLSTNKPKLFIYKKTNTMKKITPNFL